MTKVIVSFSGGKDSTVALIETMKKYPKEDIQLLFVDTGAEYKGTTEHVEGIASVLELPLTIIHPKRDWYEQIRHDNMPFTPALRKCTFRLKIDEIRRYTRNYRKDNGLLETDIITVTGIRAEESQSRSKLPEWNLDDHGQGYMWRPALYMSKLEVFERIRAEGLPIHYCYEFSSRCNCAWCIFCGKYEIQAYAEIEPDEYEKVCLLEEEIKKPLLPGYRSIADIKKQGRLI